MRGAALRQAAILSAVAFAAERFLKTSDWRSCIDEVLAKLGEATGVSRVYIFENHTLSDGSICSSQTCEWAAEGIAPQLGNPNLQSVPYALEAIEPLRTPVSKGEALVSLVRNLPEGLRGFLDPQQILSIAIVPIMTRDAWIGFLGFDDCAEERPWSEVEIDALKAASGILGAAIQRTRDEADLRHKEEQLRQAQKMEAVGTLAGGIAHDFNNVLQIIWLSGEALRVKLPTDSSMHADVQAIGDAVLRARSLPNQLLAFARRQVVQPRLQEITESVAETVELVRRVIGEDVHLDVIPSSASLLAVVDPVQLQQVVMNLLLNARDALPDGGSVRVVTELRSLSSEQVSRHARIPPGDYAVILVEDDGSGMDDETLERLFEPFYTTKARGHGIGLATVYGIVTQSGGHVTVDSAPEDGSRFCLYFPLAGEDAVDDAAPMETDLAPGGDETILVVEDEQSLRDALVERLQDLGYQVLAAGDGASAIDLLARREGGVDLLLTDVVMPRMDGATLAAKILDGYPGAKVLYMSGHAFDVLERRGIDPSSLTVLRKPFSAAEMARHVRFVLDGA
jgi:signal transduction histidine kinase